jgi:single-strand DNA-binding protein
MLPKIAEVGRLTADPEIRYTSGGKAVATVNLVFSNRKKTDAGGWVDDGVLFLRGTLWESYAENVANSLVKGDQVLVSGQIFQRDWETKDGQKRTNIELKIFDIGPVMKWNEVKIQRAERSSQQPADDPWTTGGIDEQPPF